MPKAPKPKPKPMMTEKQAIALSDRLSVLGVIVRHGGPMPNPWPPLARRMIATADALYRAAGAK